MRSKFKSFAKARVVRDNKSHKSRGYGFVSFTDPLDALAAMKEARARGASGGGVGGGRGMLVLSGVGGRRGVPPTVRRGDD